MSRVVYYRSVVVDLIVEAPNVSVYEAFEAELKRNVEAAVSNKAAAKRHGVTVRVPKGLNSHPVFVSHMPTGRR